MRILSVTFASLPNKKTSAAIPFKSRFSNGEKKPIHQKESIAYRDYALYNPMIKDFGTYKIPVHNEAIAHKLQKSYTPDEFKNLFDFTKSKGTFGLLLDEKTGLIKTSMIKHKENELMSDMIWITDTAHNIDLLKVTDPQKCTTAINKVSEFYAKNQDDFDVIINNPEKYRKNPTHVWMGQTGAGHCFVPATHKPHIWFPKTRLESMGNYLQLTTNAIKDGLEGKEYGYKNTEDIPDNVINSISSSVKYLKAIDYPYARSCGAWEEQTFDSSLTSDTSIINQAFRQIIDLMYSDTNDENLIKLRQRLLNSKHGDVFENKDELESLLKRGEERILIYPDTEAPTAIKGQKTKVNRDYDFAISFMIQTEKLDANDIEHDAAKKLLILKKLEKNLVKPNGAIRYKNDEYLNLDYHTLENQWRDNKHKNEAQWFLVSEIAKGYGSVAKELLDHIQESKTTSPKTKKLLDIAILGETEFINRSYARITPKNTTKSNGYTCPAYKIPEAYEAVTTKNGKVKYVPGAHNPLTWAESSLYSASVQFLENLERYNTAINP